MILAALCFLAGIVLVQQLPDLNPASLFILLGAASAAAVWRRAWRALPLLLGIAWALGFAQMRLHDRLPAALEGQDLVVTGQIAGLPLIRQDSVRFDFTPDDARPLPSRLRLTWYHPESALKAGQRWRFTVKLKRPHGTANPHGFDYERWLFSEGVGATGYVRRAPKPQWLANAAAADISGLRQTLLDRLAARLGGDPNQALIRALTLGDGSQITPEQWDVFRKTGTTHLIVISGSHIGLIAGLVYFLTLKIWARGGHLRWPPPRVAALAAMLVAVFYALLAGFAVPARRAVLMLAIAMGALIRQRHTRPFNTLAAALLAVLLADPLAVLAPGFWLSFCAVGLIVFALAGRLEPPGLMIGALKLHAFTALGLAPFLLGFFQQVSLIAPLANALAVPIITVCVLPPALLGLLILPISPTAADVLLWPASQALTWLIRLLEKLAEMPSATFEQALPNDWTLLAAIPGVLLLLAPFGTPSRWLGGVMLLPMLCADAGRPAPGAVKMAMLDVGQGLAVAVQTANHWLVYDTGPQFSPTSDMGRNVVLPYLLAEGATKLDALIVSHGDNDHAGGARSLLKALPIDRLLTGAPDGLPGYAPAACAAGQHWQWDGVEFTILSPAQVDPAADNDNSCVLQIRSAHGTILLTGDIEAPAESRLLKQYGDNLRADILIAPHHGSKTSSTQAFLETVRPRYILIPSGYRNSFGHPHPSVIARYRAIHAQWLNSADSGAVLVELSANKTAVQAYRELHRNYWRAE